jgi:hypothetical protein
VGPKKESDEKKTVDLLQVLRRLDLLALPYCTDWDKHSLKLAVELVGSHQVVLLTY